MRREEGAMTPILPAADEEGLDRHRPRLARQREDIGITEPLRVDRLAPLDVGQGTQAITINGGKLIILALGRGRHLA